MVLLEKQLSCTISIWLRCPRPPFFFCSPTFGGRLLFVVRPQLHRVMFPTHRPPPTFSLRTRCYFQHSTDLCPNSPTACPWFWQPPLRQAGRLRESRRPLSGSWLHRCTSGTVPGTLLNEVSKLSPQGDKTVSGPAPCLSALLASPTLGHRTCIVFP